jgi:hypothetical protein
MLVWQGEIPHPYTRTWLSNEKQVQIAKQEAKTKKGKLSREENGVSTWTWTVHSTLSMVSSEMKMHIHKIFGMWRLQWKSTKSAMV